MNKIPVIKKENGIATLYVKGKPFIALSGELHNSSASNLQYMEENVWPGLKDLNVNTLVAPIYWETIEPEKDRYDFDLLDGLIKQARDNNIHLILLWFGLWKNAESTYIPGWMKVDTTNYFRARKINGEPLNTISPFCMDAVERDAKAFSMIMEHIRQIDETESTVIMMQVENEIGLLGTDCDYCERAQNLFGQEIPGEITTEYGVEGSWEQAFGLQAREYFMAYQFAKAIEIITAAGRNKYPLPCYTNAWLKQHPWYPGSYPVGGPIKEVHTIWKLVAPSIFTLAPDIYVTYVADVIDEYGYDENPLVIPEIRNDVTSASYCMYAIGKGNAICYSPFGIEDLALPSGERELPPLEVMIALNIDPSAMDPEGSRAYLGKTYEIIEQLTPLYLAHRGTSHLQSYLKRSDNDKGILFQFDEYDLVVSYEPKTSGKPLAAGMIFEIDKNKFIITGMMSSCVFRPKIGENVKVDFIKLEEGNVVDGKFKSRRILNGDEQHVLKFGDMPSCYSLELYKF